jgi:hypothetical protein
MVLCKFPFLFIDGGRENVTYFAMTSVPVTK